MLLHLDFSPNDESISMTRDLWCEAFTRAIGRVDEELDSGRIEQAFIKFETQAIKWPSPAMIIQLLPLRPEVKRVEYNTPASPGQAGAYFDICNKVISGELTKEEAQDLMERV